MVTTKKTRAQRLSRMVELLAAGMCSLLIVSIPVWFFLLINYTERRNRGACKFPGRYRDRNPRTGGVVSTFSILIE
jgi:hypothetical protein